MRTELGSEDDKRGVLHEDMLIWLVACPFRWHSGTGRAAFQKLPRAHVPVRVQTHSGSNHRLKSNIRNKEPQLASYYRPTGSQQPLSYIRIIAQIT
jgi:hypothetical protein